MKKLISLLFLIVLGFWSIVLIKDKCIKAKTSDLILQDAEALANPEIIIGPFCIVTSGTCFVDTDGFFLRGYPQH